ncbi:glycosyltransferase family 4 protein [Dyadobacter chenwenxiniae]|uniref:Glycosyltransferase family 4 protein n=1 Tax=Dyadobacter chenwenxiniae TaxID=2906456 RepID=A0A9X1PKD9_9BACT|nr:glycosyltransferase family 4 protein [Dyadobacter chenwenxiniae]MCF0062386.1 glycosyltransferase family 4 protein [Dyadobacter chenwenxiniae]UON83859.1 glycosyltransferase family 4 protein [Dyadobacter chenwenxiniae]
MRVLVVHNQLWAHYKSRLFSEIHQAFKEKYPESDFLVIQIALYEASRSVMQSDDTITYDYPYQVLFERSLDQVSFKERRAALFAAFDAYRPTVLNITGYFDPAQVLLMFYARIKGVKVVLSSESSSADNSRSFIKESLKKLIVNRANAFFCFGKTSAEYLETLGAKPSQIPVRNAAVIDEEVVRSRYDAGKQENVNIARVARFVFVGRLAPEKNLETLLRAFAQVRQLDAELWPWEVMFIGDGPERPLLEKLTNELQLESKVLFMGGLPWYKVPDLLVHCDVLVLPSKSEPWGLVVNEAMVCGLPVIVSKNCGCVADLVENGVNGFTFDPDSQQELETAMAFFMKNLEKIAVMGRESRRLIAPFSSTQVARQMADCYHTLK